MADGEVDEGEGEEAEPEGDIDEELAAELDLALGDDEEAEDEEDEDEDEEEDESDEDDDEDDDDEDAQERKLLNEEIRDLEAAVAKKESEITISANPLIKVLCFCLSADIQRIVILRAAETIRGCPQETLRRS